MKRWLAGGEHVWSCVDMKIPPGLPVAVFILGMNYRFRDWKRRVLEELGRHFVRCFSSLLETLV